MSNSPQRPAERNPPRGRDPLSGWAGATRELTVAGLLVVVLTAAGWALDGPAAAVFVLLICIAVSLVALRALIEPDQEPPAPEASRELGPGQSFIGVWRTRSDLVDATKSLSAWEYRLRPRLTNLLAARLSERHGVSLADDPQAARDLLRGTRHDVWRWIDPSRPAPPDAESQPGIPPSVLAALIDRLEKL
jgi:hypothetical protein